MKLYLFSLKFFRFLSQFFLNCLRIDIHHKLFNFVIIRLFWKICIFFCVFQSFLKIIHEIEKIFSERAIGILEFSVSDFEKKNRLLALNLFGSHELTDENREMLEYIIYSGTYGKLENSVRNRLKKYGRGMLGKIKYLTAKILPERERIKTTNPFMSKYKALYPILVIYRLMKTLLTKRREILRELSILFYVE